VDTICSPGAVEELVWSPFSIVEWGDPVPSSWVGWLMEVEDADQITSLTASTLQICGREEADKYSTKLTHSLAKSRNDEAYTVRFRLRYHPECSPAVIEFHVGKEDDENITTWDLKSAVYAETRKLKQEPGSSKTLGRRPDPGAVFQPKDTWDREFGDPYQPFEDAPYFVDCLVEVTPVRIRAEIRGYVYETSGTERYDPNIDGWKGVTVDSGDSTDQHFTKLRPVDCYPWWFEIPNGGIEISNVVYLPSTVTVEEDLDSQHGEEIVTTQCGRYTLMGDNMNYSTRKKISSEPFTEPGDPIFCPGDLVPDPDRSTEGRHWVGPNYGSLMTVSAEGDGFSSTDKFSRIYRNAGERSLYVASASRHCYGKYTISSGPAAPCKGIPNSLEWCFWSNAIFVYPPNQPEDLAPLDTFWANASEGQYFPDPTPDNKYPRMRQRLKLCLSDIPTGECYPQGGPPGVYDGSGNCYVKMSRPYIDADSGASLTATCITADKPGAVPERTRTVTWSF